MIKGKFHILNSEDPTQIDSIGFQSRLEGHEVRDCILDNKCELRLLTRSEMGGTVLESVLTKGTGALDIDPCRIGSEERTYDLKGGENLNQISRSGGNDSKDAKGLDAYGIGAKQISIGKKTVSGRFPANMIIKHGSSCYCEGTVTISNTDGRDGSITDTPARSWKNTSNEGIARKGYGGPEGEEVPNWICDPSCPVKMMDSQSGILKSGDITPYKRSTSPVMYGIGDWQVEVTSCHTGDSGGASRYFKQVQTEEELDEYLKTLVRGKTNE